MWRAVPGGYVRFEVYADGKFIVLPKAVFTEEDFKNGVCEIPYQIDQHIFTMERILRSLYHIPAPEHLCSGGGSGRRGIKGPPGIWQA